MFACFFCFSFESSRLSFWFRFTNVPSQRLLELTIPILIYRMVRTITNCIFFKISELEMTVWDILIRQGSFIIILDTIFVEIPIKEWDKAVKKF